MSIVVALYSIKGGVGKTAAAVNLSYLAAEEGFQTLLIDLDPQGSASFYFRIRPRKTFRAKGFVRGGRTLEKNIRGTDYDNLDSLPAHLSFGKLDLKLDGYKKPRDRLAKILRPLLPPYDWIFLDCPPGLTLLSESVFRAARVLLVPVIPTPLSVLAYGKLIGFFDRKNLDSSKIRAFFSMVEIRKRLHRDTLLKRLAGESGAMNSTIPYASVVEKMGIHREPLFRFAGRSVAAEAYRQLWGEIRSTLTAPAEPR